MRNIKYICARNRKLDYSDVFTEVVNIQRNAKNKNQIEKTIKKLFLSQKYVPNTTVPLVLMFLGTPKNNIHDSK